MAQKNDTPALLLSLVITLGLLGAGAWWFINRIGPMVIAPGGVNPSGTSGNWPNSNPNGGVDARLSTGERLLVTSVASDRKLAGIQAYQAGQFEQAVSSLEASLRTTRNDPEALIYLNNAAIANGESYTIAVAVPAATAANPAQEILRGVAQAQKEINARGGINGVPLRVLIASDDNDPEVARQVATALVKDSSVLGVIGHFGSDASLAAVPVYSQGNMAMISPTSTSVQLSGAGQSIFRTVPSDRFTATALSRYMVNRLGLQNAVIFYNSGSDYSRSLKDELTTALYSDGGQVVTEIDLSSPSFNATKSVNQALQDQADVLILASNTATLDQALQVVAANQTQLPLLGGDSLYNPKLLEVEGDNAKGMVVAVPWVLLSDPNSSFAQSSRQLWGGDVNWRTAMSYDATQALAQGLQQAGSTSRDALVTAMHSSGFSVEGATGAVRFLPSGDRNQAMQLVVVSPGQRSGYGYDFVPAP